jgi:hypothetical protein
MNPGIKNSKGSSLTVTALLHPNQETSMKMIYMDLGLSAKHLEKSFSL